MPARLLWPVGQEAKTSPSHGENMGSIPVPAIMFIPSLLSGGFLYNVFYIRHSE